MADMRNLRKNDELKKCGIHVKFNEDNVHSQCKRCNYFLSGNLLPYRDNLILKIGQERFDKITLTTQMSKKYGFKWDRFYLLDVIEKYKNK